MGSAMKFGWVKTTVPTLNVRSTPDFAQNGNNTVGAISSNKSYVGFYGDEQNDFTKVEIFDESGVTIVGWLFTQYIRTVELDKVQPVRLAGGFVDLPLVTQPTIKVSEAERAFAVELLTWVSSIFESMPMDEDAQTVSLADALKLLSQAIALGQMQVSVEPEPDNGTD